MSIATLGIDLGKNTLHPVTGQGWSLKRLRERVLKTAARIRAHARPIRAVLEQTAIRVGQRLFQRPDRLRWEGG